MMAQRREQFPISEVERRGRVHHLLNLMIEWFRLTREIDKFNKVA